MWDVTAIYPATGWSATYVGDDAVEFSRPLAGWAVARHKKTGRTEIVGLDASDSVKFADEWCNFDHYEPSF